MLGLGLGLQRHSMQAGEKKDTLNKVLDLQAMRTDITKNTWTDLSRTSEVEMIGFSNTTQSGWNVEDGKKYLTFDGTKDYCRVSNVPEQNITSPPIAIFITFKVNEYDSSLIFKGGNGAYQTQLGIRINNNQQARCYLNTNSGWTSFSEKNVIETDTWFDVGYIWDSDKKATLFINGEAIVSAIVDETLIQGDNMTIGARHNVEMEDFFKGHIANVQVYKSDDVENIMKERKRLAQPYGVEIELTPSNFII